MGSKRGPTDFKAVNDKANWLTGMFVVRACGSLMLYLQNAVAMEGLN